MSTTKPVATAELGITVSSATPRPGLGLSLRSADLEGDALDEFNKLAEQERRRNPSLTKAQAFAKAYTDPANAQLAAREEAEPSASGMMVRSGARRSGWPGTGVPWPCARTGRGARS
jgi:hypothetical protein